MLGKKLEKNYDKVGSDETNLLLRATHKLDDV